MTESEAILISGVSERDLDLLLLEEIVASEGFRQFITERAGLEIEVENATYSVRRSVTHSVGESDLELLLMPVRQSPVGILVENKVAAAFQPSQAERYRERGRQLCANGSCSTIRTLLVAPSDYLGTPRSLHGFDAMLSYEDIRSWFHEQGGLGDRVRYKCALLSAAIDHASHGYQAVADDQVTAFWTRYSEVVAREAPQLNMPPVKGRPAGSTFIFLKPDALPRGLLLVHKFQHGFIDLEFTGWGARLSSLREALVGIDWDGAQLVRIGKSAALRWPVAPLGVGIADPDGAEMTKGIERAASTLEWVRSNRERLETIVAP